MIRFLRVLAQASGTRRAAATASLRSKQARPTAKDIIAQNKPASECLTLFIDVFVQQFKDLRTQIDVSAAASLPPLSKFFVVCEPLPTLPTLPFSCSPPLFCLRKTAFKLCISFTPEHLMRFFLCALPTVSLCFPRLPSEQKEPLWPRWLGVNWISSVSHHLLGLQVQLHSMVNLNISGVP